MGTDTHITSHMVTLDHGLVFRQTHTQRGVCVSVCLYGSGIKGNYSDITSVAAVVSVLLLMFDLSPSSLYCGTVIKAHCTDEIQ